MKQCNHAIDGFRSGLSPSARPFAIGSSSLAFTATKSEHEDSLWGDYTLDLSFLSSDDQKSGLDDVEATIGGQLFEENIACSGNVLVNPNPLFLELPKLLIQSPKVAGDDQLDLSCANTTVMSQKSSTHSDPEDSEVDSPCWRGIHSHKNLPSAVKSVTSRRSTDDLNGIYRLNPLAPQFIPSNSKKNLDTDWKKCEEETSSSLKKSLSSTFPSSSGEFSITYLPKDGRNDAARIKNILTNNADESFGFVSQDSVSKTVSMSDSRNEFQISKRLDPLAPVFVPSSAKPSPSVHEKQGAFETNSLSISALTSSSDNKSLNKVKVVTCSGEVGHSFKSQYGVLKLGSTSSYNPSFESNGGITEYAKLGSSRNKSHGQRRLNPLAPQFSLADTKPKAYGYDKNQAADDLSLGVNSAGLSPPIGYSDDNAVDADLAQSSVYVERLLPNMSGGSSLLISSKADSSFGSTKRFVVEPTTTLSVKEYKDFNHPLPFHVVETASSSDVKALSCYGQRHSSSAPSPSPKVDVKKLLTTMHGLSELLTLADGSESSDSLNAQEVDLINSTVQNLNLYMTNSFQEQARNHSSYDLKLSPKKSKLSIRDLQLPRANNMTVDLDVKRKEKYSVVSGETVASSRLCEYGATKDNNFGQVVGKSGYQPNHQGEGQVNPHALFYKSLWLKAEAERCLMVYETCLSDPDS